MIYGSKYFTNVTKGNNDDNTKKQTQTKSKKELSQWEMVVTAECHTARTFVELSALCVCMSMCASTFSRSRIKASNFSKPESLTLRSLRTHASPHALGSTIAQSDVYN